MNYELAKKLKDLGFPQVEVDGLNKWYVIPFDKDGNSDESKVKIVIGGGLKEGTQTVYIPTLSELIEVCGEGFNYLTRGFGEVKWYAGKSKKLEDVMLEGYGSTPEEAVANLWLALQNKKS